MITLLAAIVLAQPADRYLSPSEAVERVLPLPWREVVTAPESVTFEGLIPRTKQSRDVKVRWRRVLDEEYGDPVAEVDTQGLGNPPAARVEDET